MLNHYIKQSIRGMRKNKVFTLLNISGFAAGFAAFLLLALYTYQEYTVDKSVPNSQNIYRLINTENNSSLLDYKAAMQLQSQFPEIEVVVPLEYWESSKKPLFLQKADESANINISELISTSNDFFRVFSPKVLVGDPLKPFNNKNSLVITESVAKKLYGTLDVLGKDLNINDYFKGTISAVIEDFSSNMSVSGDVILNNENPDSRFSTNAENNIFYNPITTYLVVDSKTDILGFQSKLNASFPDNKMHVKKVALQPLSKVYLDREIGKENHKTGNKTMIKLFLAIALLTLLLSVINYVNFSTTRQLSTLKDYGIKITNGAGRHQMRNFYAVDVGLLIIISVLLASIIVVITLPLASQLLNTSLNPNLFFSKTMLVVLLATIITVWLISTIAPLSILSKFDIQMLFGKKTNSFSKQNWKNVFTIFQLVISIILLSSIFIIQKQLNYVKNYDLGFNNEHLLQINIPNNFQNKEALKSKLTALAFVNNFSFTNGTPGTNTLYIGDDESDKKDFSPRVFYIDENFINTFGITLIEGRKQLNSDLKKACYMNETAMKKFEWDSYEGKVFSKEYKVIGVVKDFNTNSLRDQIEPVCLIFEDSFINALYLKLGKGSLGDQMKTIQHVWKDVAGNTPFQFTFYDDYFNKLYDKEDRQAKTLGLFGILAIIITAIGLLGQIFQNTQNRIKEIGVRKINGARIIEIMFLLNGQLLKWVVVAFILGTPIAYYAMNKWLENFAYKTTLSWWVFALAGFSALIIALLTVTWQSWRAANKNPVEALRYE